jgi:hypothetical protein
MEIPIAPAGMEVFLLGITLAIEFFYVSLAYPRSGNIYLEERAKSFADREITNQPSLEELSKLNVPVKINFFWIESLAWINPLFGSSSK